MESPWHLPQIRKAFLILEDGLLQLPGIPKFNKTGSNYQHKKDGGRLTTTKNKTTETEFDVERIHDIPAENFYVRCRSSNARR
jgi:hypothetical protein